MITVVGQQHQVVCIPERFVPIVTCFAAVLLYQLFRFYLDGMQSSSNPSRARASTKFSSVTMHRGCIRVVSFGGRPQCEVTRSRGDWGKNFGLGYKVGLWVNLKETSGAEQDRRVLRAVDDPKITLMRHAVGHGVRRAT